MRSSSIPPVFRTHQCQYILTLSSLDLVHNVGRHCLYSVSRFYYLCWALVSVPVINPHRAVQHVPRWCIAGSLDVHYQVIIWTG